MIKGKAKLVIDLGNSETRVKTLYGKRADGASRSHLSIMSNRYSEIPESQVMYYQANQDVYSEENSRIFKVADLYYCTGLLCDTEYGSTSIRPTALEKKYTSITSKLAITNAFMEGYNSVAALTNSDVSQLDLDWDVTIMLPPEDIDAGSRQISDMIRSIKNIDFRMPVFNADIKIDKVTVYPEGFCAFMGILFEHYGKLRQGYEYLAQNSTLVIDIGAGTTDFLLVRNAKVVTNSRFTRDIGGNNVHRRVQKMLRDEGYSLPDADVRRGCVEGVVHSGAKTIEIYDMIAEAKKEVSRQLVDAVQELFESSMIPVNTITNLLVCGGGAESSENEKIRPIAEYIVDYMRRLAPDIRLVEMPKVEENGELKQLSPRLLNINGAGILSE